MIEREDSDYTARQASKDAQAAATYKEMESSLPADVRAALAGKDGHVGLAAGYSANHSHHDISELQIGQPENVTGSIDRLQDTLAEQFDLTPGQAEGIAEWHRKLLEAEATSGVALRLARAIGVLLRAKNLGLEVRAIAYATGTAGVNGLGTMRKCAPQISKEDGRPVTVSALSKRACWWHGFLKLPPSPEMKSMAAVASYSKSRKENHWRKNPDRIRRLLDRI